MKCSECEFFEKGDMRPHEGKILGECRGTFPMPNVSGGFAKVYSNKWCAKFRPRKEAKK